MGKDRQKSESETLLAIFEQQKLQQEGSLGQVYLESIVKFSPVISVGKSHHFKMPSYCALLCGELYFSRILLRLKKKERERETTGQTKRSIIDQSSILKAMDSYDLKADV